MVEIELPLEVELSQTKSLRNALRRIPLEVWELPPEELERQASPSPLMWSLKASYWLALTRAREQRKPLSPTDVWMHLCTRQHWHSSVLEIPVRLAWLATPSLNQRSLVEALAHNSLAKLQDLLECPITTESGRFIKSAAEMRLEAAKFLVGLDARMRRLSGATEYNSENIKDVDKRIAELEAEVRPTR